MWVCLCLDSNSHLQFCPHCPTKCTSHNYSYICDAEHWLSWGGRCGKKFPFYSPSDHQMSGQRRGGGGVGVQKFPTKLELLMDIFHIAETSLCTGRLLSPFSYCSWIDFDVTLSMIVLKEVIWILSFWRDRQRMIIEKMTVSITRASLCLVICE